jgi:hypothetical protein
VLEKREITKYRKFHPEPVYLTTIIKQLDEEPENTPLQVVSR